jgi:hypothetical protein
VKERATRWNVGQVRTFGVLQRQVHEARREARGIGPYLLKRLLGKGGMGEAYLAEHKLLKRPCAVKLIGREFAEHPDSVARFAREVQAVTALNHLNTVRVYDYGRAGPCQPIWPTWWHAACRRTRPIVSRPQPKWSRPWQGARACAK